MTTTGTTQFSSSNGRGGRILLLNIISDRDFRHAGDHVSCIIVSLSFFNSLVRRVYELLGQYRA